MEVRDGLRYLRTHQWMKEEDGQVVIGTTDYAQMQLHSVVFVNLPEADEHVTAGKSFAEVESVKVVSEVHSPVTGTVSEINEALLDEPEQLNSDPYDAWLIKVSEITERADLLTADEYRDFLETLKG